MPSLLPWVRIRRAVRRSPVGRRTSSASSRATMSSIRVAVLRKARVVAPVALGHALPRGAVDVVDRPGDRRRAAGDQRLAQRVGRDREIRERAEAAEALPEDAPALDPERLAQQLGVAHDRVGPEVLRGRRRSRYPSTGVERPVPRWSSSSQRKSFNPRSRNPGPRGLPVTRNASWPGPPWKNTRNGLSRPSGSATSRAKTVICSPSGCAVVERHAQLVVDHDEAGQRVAHATDSRKPKNRALQRSRASIGGKWPDSSNHSVSTRPS